MQYPEMPWIVLRPRANRERLFRGMEEVVGIKSILTAACVAVFAAGVGVANAAPVFVQSVESYTPGSGTRTPDGFVAAGDLVTALARVEARDGSFLSLGTGGSIVLGFGTGSFVGTTLFEVTNNCATGGTGCGHWPESVEIHIGNSPIGDWSLAGTITNSDTPASVTGNTRGYSLNIDSPFSFLRLVDTSTFGAASNAGWDIDAVSVAPIPVPAALPLLLAGLGGMAFVGRRRNKAA